MTLTIIPNQPRFRKPSLILFSLGLMIARCFLLFVVALPGISCASQLPSSAHPVLLAELHAKQVLGADDLHRRTVGSYDYLGFQGHFEISWGFESVYHPEVVLRKRRSDKDWSKADVLSCRDLDATFRLSDNAFARALSPWRHETYENAVIIGRQKDVTRADIAAAVAAVRDRPNRKEPRVNLQLIDVISRDEIQLEWDRSGPHRAHDYIQRINGRWQWVMESIDVG